MKKSAPETANNRPLGEIFHRMSACYRYLGADQRFRAIAYDNASRTIAGLKEDVSVYAGDKKALDQLHGIGESIADKIIEYLHTGRIKAYDQLKKKVPGPLLELMDITGFGPATVKMLHSKFGVDNQAELIDVIESGVLKGQRGFGPKKIENLMHGLKLYKARQQRMLLSEALQVGNSLATALLKIPGIEKAALAGSLRRRKETIGDIDIVVAANNNGRKKLVQQVVRLPQVGRVLASGETKISFLLNQSPAQVDIRLVAEEEYGAALMYFTGSKEHNVKLRTWAREKNWKLNEYGLFNARTGKKLAGRTEAEIYERLGMQFIPPELREEKGEIELALKKRLPALVQVSDIRGDLQMHSRWSDGAENIETIAAYVLQNFPAYEYIVMTDHSPSQRVAGGMPPAEFQRQFREIDRVNKKLGKAFVKKGVEVDILADGSLDLPDDLLAQFEWVTASIHSGFNRDNTDRLVKACHHPMVNCIGHPSGRLIGKREAYMIDWKWLFNSLLNTGTAIEINSQPDRLDLRDELVKDAAGRGLTITISTDAHMLSQFENIQLGVSVARRGWCSKKNILNTQPWKNIEKFRAAKLHLFQTVIL